MATTNQPPNPGAATNPTAGEQQQGQPGQGAPGQPQPAQAPAGSQGKQFSQADVDRIAGDARAEGRAAAAREAAQAAQAEQGQYKPLYETEKARADTLQTSLDTLQASFDKLRTAFHSNIDAQIEELPESQRDKWKALKPTSDDPEVLQQFVKTAREIAGVAQAVPPAPRMPQSPAALGQQGELTTEQARQARIDEAKRTQSKRGGGSF